MLNNKKAFCLFGEPHNFADKNKIFSIEFKFAENCQDGWGERCRAAFDFASALFTQIGPRCRTLSQAWKGQVSKIANDGEYMMNL